MRFIKSYSPLHVATHIINLTIDRKSAPKNIAFNALRVQYRP